MSEHELQAFDSAAMPWEERFVPVLGKALFAKAFLEDPDTGVAVRMVKYPAERHVLFITNKKFEIWYEKA